MENVSRRTPLAMFFPVGAVLVYAGNDVRPVLDPECCHGACKCCLRASDAQCWGVFLEKVSAVVGETPPSAKGGGGMPTLHVVCEQHAQVVLLTMARDRFGKTTVEDKFTLH